MGFNQLAVFTFQPVGWDAAVVLMVEMVFIRCAFYELQCGTLREVVARERQGAL